MFWIWNNTGVDQNLVLDYYHLSEHVVVRQALDKLATDSDSQYQVGLAALNRNFGDDDNNWAINMLRKSGLIKEQEIEKLIDHARQTPAQQDKASLAEKGGIDLNQINVLRKGKTVNVQFDPAQLNELMQGGFQGFTPVIINITHISSPFQLLGINPAKQPEVLAKA